MFQAKVVLLMSAIWEFAIRFVPRMVASLQDDYIPQDISTLPNLSGYQNQAQGGYPIARIYWFPVQFPVINTTFTSIHLTEKKTKDIKEYQQSLQHSIDLRARSLVWNVVLVFKI